jgi:hypothetical protein
MTPTAEELQDAIVHMVNRLNDLRLSIRREAFNEAARLVETSNYYEPLETLARNIRSIDGGA